MIKSWWKTRKREYMEIEELYTWISV